MNPTRRRALLGLCGLGLAAAVAGCGEETTDSAPDSDDPDEDDTADADDTGSDADGDEHADIPADAAVSFEAPDDGATAANGVIVSMAAENFEIRPAGEATDDTGYFHLGVDRGPIDPGEQIPREAGRIHYDDGGTRDVLELPVGTHELTLQPADGAGRALPLSASIEIAVEAGGITVEAPEDGATVRSPVGFEFGTTGALEATPADDSPEIDQTAGYFVVGRTVDPTPTGEPIPESDARLHLRGGAVATDLELPPGEHDVLIQMAGPDRRALPETARVTLTVEAEPETVVVAPDGVLAFEPESLTVPLNTTVEFLWEGNTHNINVREQPADADWAGVEETRNEGFRHEHTFEVPGSYEYRCDPHSLSMQATITVEE